MKYLNHDLDQDLLPVARLMPLEVGGARAETLPRADAPVLIKWLAVLNPLAGKPKGTGQLQRITERLERDLGARVAVTFNLHELGRILEVDAGVTALAVYGGDGSVAEVVNRMDLDHQRLLVLPGGTGNGLARDLGLTTLDRALAAARADRHSAVDLLQVVFSVKGHRTTRWVVSTCAVGYVADVAVQAAQFSRRLGSLRYTLASVLLAKGMPVHRLNVQINEEANQSKRVTNLLINNTRYAGNFRAFKSASLVDCRMDVLLACTTWGPQLFHNMAVLTGTYFYTSAEEFNAGRLRVSSATPFRLLLDGEAWDGVNEASFTVHPGRLLCYLHPSLAWA